MPMKKLFLLSVLASPTYIVSMMSNAAFAARKTRDAFGGFAPHGEYLKQYDMYDELLLKQAMSDEYFAKIIGENFDLVEADLSQQALDERLDAIWKKEQTKFRSDMEKFESNNKPEFVHTQRLPYHWGEMKNMAQEARLLLEDEKRRCEKKCNSLPLLREKVLFARMIHAHKKK